MYRSFINFSILLCTAGSAMAQQADSSAAPAPVYPIPSRAQLAWHELETYAFIHFGLNTYNDLEWGYGNTPATTFAPKELDVEQWVRTLKRAGMKGVILTAKHHDGFCLWPTKTTDYSVRNSPWKHGKGDLVGDLSKACRKHGLKFGLYLSPWDRHHSEYGRPAYQKVFHEQIRELTTNYGPLFEYWFDGANGGTGWYGGADEARSINPKEYYLYEDAAKMLRINNPDIMIFGGTVPTIRWVGNERGWAGETNWAGYDFSQEKHYSDAQWGMRDALQWLPAEVDVSIRPGWFYHKREDHQVRTVADLVGLYYRSVGRGANLLLNCPINLDGKIPRQDSVNLVHWRDYLTRSFSHDLLRGVKPIARSTRSGAEFAALHLTDGKPSTYWATSDGVTTSEVCFSFAKPTRLNMLVLQEYIALGQRVEEFAVDYLDVQGKWHVYPTEEKMTTIGYKRLLPATEPVVAKSIRLRILRARGPICLSTVSAYSTPMVVETPTVYRDSHDKLTISSLSRGARYRVVHSSGRREVWSKYEPKSSVLSGDHVAVEVAFFSPEGKMIPGSLHPYDLGYSTSHVTIAGLSESDREALLDGNGYTALLYLRGRPL